MHRALSIVELIIEVFHHLENVAEAKATTVCKTWSEIALDSIWFDLRDQYPLFRVLYLRRAESGRWVSYILSVPPSLILINQTGPGEA